MLFRLYSFISLFSLVRVEPYNAQFTVANENNLLEDNVPLRFKCYVSVATNPTIVFSAQLLTSTGTAPLVVATIILKGNTHSISVDVKSPHGFDSYTDGTGLPYTPLREHGRNVVYLMYLVNSTEVQVGDLNRVSAKVGVTVDLSKVTQISVRASGALEECEEDAQCMYP